MWLIVPVGPHSEVLIHIFFHPAGSLLLCHALQIRKVPFLAQQAQKTTYLSFIKITDSIYLLCSTCVCSCSYISQRSVLIGNPITFCVSITLPTYFLHWSSFFCLCSLFWNTDICNIKRIYRRCTGKKELGTKEPVNPALVALWFVDLQHIFKRVLRLSTFDSALISLLSALSPFFTEHCFENKPGLMWDCAPCDSGLDVMGREWQSAA